MSRSPRLFCPLTAVRPLTLRCDRGIRTRTDTHTYTHKHTHARTPAALVPDPHFASVLSAALVTASAAGRLLEDLPVDGVGFVLV